MSKTFSSKSLNFFENRKNISYATFKTRNAVIGDLAFRASFHFCWIPLIHLCSHSHLITTRFKNMLVLCKNCLSESFLFEILEKASGNFCLKLFFINFSFRNQCTTSILKLNSCSIFRPKSFSCSMKIIMRLHRGGRNLIEIVNRDDNIINEVHCLFCRSQKIHYSI